MGDMERKRYGVLESNGMEPGEIDTWLDRLEGEEDLDSPDLARITRLRVLSDPGFPYWDLSYCYGQRKDGTHCRVNLPRHQFRKRTFMQDLVDMCRDSGVFGKALGLFDEEVISKCL